jgi:hypothetical protein
MVSQTTLGPFPHGIAFHPHLPLAVSYRYGEGEVIVFHAKSGIKRNTEKSTIRGTPLVVFGGEGTKAIYLGRTHAGIEGKTGVKFVSVKLTEAEKAILGKFTRI